MRKNNKILIVLITIVLLVGIVVVFIVGENKDSGQAINQPEAVEKIAAADTEMQAADDQQVADPTQTKVEENQILPTPRTSLESTDPATVSLASGEIQLIEIFAFW